jgi:hypothetical protein
VNGNGKTYIPQFAAGQELFRGWIRFNGRSFMPFGYQTILLPVNVELEDPRWGSWPNGGPEVQLDWELGYSIPVDFTGPGKGWNSGQTHYRGITGRVFIREGALYLRPEYKEMNVHVDPKLAKGGRYTVSKREIGEAVWLLPR